MALRPAWTRFKCFVLTEPLDARRYVLRVSGVAFAPLALFFVAGLISVIFSPVSWDLAWPYVMVGLILAVLVPVLISAIIQRLLGNRQPPAPPDERTHPGSIGAIGAATALANLLLTVFVNLSIIVAVIPFAVDVHIGGAPILENLEFSKAMLLVAPFALVSSLTWLCYYAELFDPPFDA